MCESEVSSKPSPSNLVMFSPEWQCIRWLIMHGHTMVSIYICTSTDSNTKILLSLHLYSTCSKFICFRCPINLKSQTKTLQPTLWGWVNPIWKLSKKLAEYVLAICPCMWLKYNSPKKRLIVEIIGKGGDDKEEEVWGSACYHQVTTTPHCAVSFRGNSCSEASKLLLTASAQTTLHSTELPRSQTGWQNTQRGALKRTLYCCSLAREVFLFSPWSVVQWVRSGLEGLEALHAMRPHNLSRLVSSGRGHSDNPANLLCHHHHHILQLPSQSGSTKCRSWRNIMETIRSHTFIVVYDEARGSLLVVLCRRV